MEEKSPYKILKLINGDDVFCKVLREYDDALLVELPMSVMKHQVHQDEMHVVEHTGLHRWINYSNDSSYVIYKDRILSFGTLAPEVIFYYKMFCKRIRGSPVCLRFLSRDAHFFLDSLSPASSFLIKLM